MATLSLEAVDFCKFFGFGAADARNIMAPALAESPSGSSSDILEFLFSGDYAATCMDKPCVKAEPRPRCPSESLGTHRFDGSYADPLSIFGFGQEPLLETFGVSNSDTSDSEPEHFTAACLPIKEEPSLAQETISPASSPIDTASCTQSRSLSTRPPRASKGSSPRDELASLRAGLCELPPVRDRKIGKWYRDKQNRKRYWSGSKLLCEHRKPMSVCKQCGGGSLCAHGRVKYTCKTCDGSAVCEHDVVKYSCRRCLDRKRARPQQ